MKILPPDSATLATAGVANLRRAWLNTTLFVGIDYGVLDEAKGIALRGVFLINPDGVVQSETVNFFNVGRNVDEILRTLDAAQQAAKTGEVCPANWSKGKETINPKEASKFFEKVK